MKFTALFLLIVIFAFVSAIPVDDSKNPSEVQPKFSTDEKGIELQYVFLGSRDPDEIRERLKNIPVDITEEPTIKQNWNKNGVSWTTRK